MHAVHRCGLLLPMSHVAWSVCLCTGHTDVLRQNGWNDRNAVGGWLMWVQKTTY